VILLAEIWLIVKDDFQFGKDFVAAFSEKKAAWENCEKLAYKAIDELKEFEWKDRPATFKVKTLKSEDFPIEGIGIYAKEKRRRECLEGSFLIKKLPFEELPKPTPVATIIDGKTGKVLYAAKDAS